MGKNELAKKLNEMYNNSKEGEKVSMIHLFGIKYSEEIRQSGVNSREIAELAEIKPSYATEISKGIKLAKYVKPI